MSWGCLAHRDGYGREHVEGLRGADVERAGLPLLLLLMMMLLLLSKLLLRFRSGVGGRSHGMDAAFLVGGAGIGLSS